MFKAKKKKNCVNNPNCLFGLGEGKQIRLQDIIGPDPSSEGREENSFCGLKVKFLFLLFQAKYLKIKLEFGCYLLYELSSSSIISYIFIFFNSFTLF